MNRRQFLRAFSATIVTPASRAGPMSLVGDGVTDNGPILDRILSTNTRYVSFPTGRFLFANPILMKSGLTIEGHGNETELVRAFDGVFIQGEGLSSVGIYSLAIKDHRERIPAPFIYLNSRSQGKSIDVGQVFIDAPRSAGIAIDHTDGVRLANNHVDGASHGDSLRCAKCRDVNIFGNSLTNLSELSNERRAIQVGGSHKVVVSNNYISDARDSFALDFGGSSEVLATRNTVINCAFGVDLEGGSRSIVIRRNSFRQTVPLPVGSIGVYLINGACEDIEISENIFSSLDVAVRIEGSTKVSVRANQFLDCKSTVAIEVANRGEVPTAVNVRDNVISSRFPQAKPTADTAHPSDD